MTEVIECLLMFLLDVLLDLTDELDVFCSSFATQNTQDSLYSILTYQIIFPPPSPRLLSFQFSNPLVYAPLLLGTQEYTNLNMQNFLLMLTFSIVELFCKFCPKVNLAFWFCLINLPVF